MEPRQTAGKVERGRQRFSGTSWKVESRSGGCEVPRTSWPVFPASPYLPPRLSHKSSTFPPQFVFEFTPCRPPEPPVVGIAGGRAGVGPDAGGGQAGLTRLACILFLTLTN